MTFVLTAGVLVALIVSYALGYSNGRGEELVQKDRACAVSECSHELHALHESASHRSSDYLMGVHDAHRVVVRCWLDELGHEDTASPNAVLEAVFAAPSRWEPDPEGDDIELVGEPRRARSWLLNQPRHVPR
jgi:hypothetical protein